MHILSAKFTKRKFRYSENMHFPNKMEIDFERNINLIFII